MYESLESRRHLSSSINNGVLTVNGTANADNLQVYVKDGLVSVNDNGTIRRYSGVKSVTVNGNDGNDTLTVFPSITVTASINGGTGNDTITSGSASDAIDGGEGIDTVTYAVRTAGVQAQITSVRDSSTRLTTYAGNGGDLANGENDAFKNIERVIGTQYADVLGFGGRFTNPNEENSYGSSFSVGSDFAMYGLGGDDSLYTSWVSGGSLYGGDGNDQFRYFGTSRTAFFGEAGNDLFEEAFQDDDASNSVLPVGGSGTDKQTVYSRGNYLWHSQLGPGVENAFLELAAHGGRVELLGNELDNVIIIGADEYINVYGFGGNDTILGAGIAYGGDGNDTITGDKVYGDAGDDDLTAEHHGYGGTGNDTLRLNDEDKEPWEDWVNPETGEVTTIQFNYELWGEEGDDVLFGSIAPDLLYGGLGRDALFGRGDPDKLYGGYDDDYLEGNDGDDYLEGNGGNDQLRGNGGNDTLLGSSGVDTFYGGSGNDYLMAKDGFKDYLYGDTGTDRAQRDDSEAILSSIESRVS